MKKSIKNIAVAMILGTASTMAFATPHDSGALDSGFRKGTAYTVEDDVYTLMNVNDWKKLQFTNMFGFINVNGTDDSGNFAVATHLKNKDVVGFSWEGNTWSDESHNEFNGFYGWQNKAIKAYIKETTYNSTSVGSTSVTDYKLFGLGALFGMNVNEKIAFNAGMGMNFADGNTVADTKAKEFDFVLKGAFIYTFKEAKDLTVKGYAFYNGLWDNQTVTVKYGDESKDVKGLNSYQTFGAGVKAQYKPTSLFTYGFYLECPWRVNTSSGDNIDSTTTGTWALEMGNGLSFTMKPEKIYLNLGLLTYFPEIVKTDDADATFGDFRNSYCGGLSFLVTPEIRIDLSAMITPEDGISFEEVWKQRFNISLRAKF